MKRGKGSSRTGREQARRASAAVAIALALGAAAAGAIDDPAPGGEPEPRRVLVLYSNSRLLPANIEADRGLRGALQDPARPPVLLFDEFVDAPRFDGEEHRRVVEQYLRDKYAARPPEAIVAFGEIALSYLLHDRSGPLARVPVVHAAVPRSFLRSLPPLADDIFGAPVHYDFAGTIEQALSWHPRARRLVLVSGTSVQDREWEGRLKEAGTRFAGRVTVEHLAGRPGREVLSRLKELGRDAVVFTPGYFRDGEGRQTIPRQAVEAMVAASTAPVYGPFDTFLGSGIVGGRMVDLEAIGRVAGEMVSELLAGRRPALAGGEPLTPTTLNVDWRQIRRWGIDEELIPADAVVHFREPTLFDEHKGLLLFIAVGFAIQTALIGLLVAERRRRLRAELAEESQRSELAHASRLAIAGVLAGSIAHEINQPLGAILSNADAADLMLEAGPVERDELRAILADIRRADLRASEVIRRLRGLLAKKQVEHQPFEIGETAREVAIILRAEARRRGVALEVQAPPRPVTLVGDRVQTQQVMINLVLNAFDAVEEAPAGRRVVVLTVDAGPESVEITVRDRGAGIAPEDLPKLFESFFSTKRRGMGLGLSIARTLVEAHRGRIWAEPGQSEGAVFHVELPLPGVARVGT